jgi:dTDP-4-dehydrorhamnose reductase
MIVLIIGASGLVGSALAEVCRRAGDRVHGTYRGNERPGLTQLDLRDRRALCKLVRDTGPEVIYLPAAVTKVDWCEQHEAESYSVNVTGPAKVAEAVGTLPVKLVYFSTDYVFDGLNGPYGEEDAPNPVNVYGRHKLAAEGILRQAVKSHLIVRTTWVYGAEQPPRNFAARTVQQLRAGIPVKVPVDQWGNPTYVSDLAALVREAVDKGITGILNAVGPQIVNRYEFALTLARVFDLPLHLITPVYTPELGQVAKRPLQGGLVVDRAKSLLSTSPRAVWEGLQAMKKVLQ